MFTFETMPAEGLILCHQSTNKGGILLSDSSLQGKVLLVILAKLPVTNLDSCNTNMKMVIKIHCQYISDGISCSMMNLTITCSTFIMSINPSRGSQAGLHIPINLKERVEVVFRLEIFMYYFLHT